MQLKIYSCSRCVGENTEFIKYGKTSAGKQRYQCTTCKKTSVLNFTYNAYCKTINPKIIQLTKEGLGIRSTARILKISTTTLINRIVKIASKIKSPALRPNQSYEIDEIYTFVRNKTNRFWLAYAINKKTLETVSFCIGKRNNNTIGKITSHLLLANPFQIFTDSLRNYKYLIPASIHKTKRYGTNRIERKNLSIRTHIKRLNRRTICFSRSLLIFSAVMKIYFWGKSD